MAAASSSGSSKRPSTLVLTDSASGDLVARQWKVVVVDGPDAGKSMERRGGTIVLGAHRDADLTLSDPAVSRYHAELRLLPEGVFVVDLGSRNGTKVGGVRVERALVPPGGTFRVGKTELAVRAEDERVRVGGAEAFGDFKTKTNSARRVLAQMKLVAPTEATVLIEGETGTGKELLARAIHAHSARADGPFIVVDCGAVTDSLLESQLFGHEKGAFTGASEARAGAFEAANGGTVFLDELGELPLELQPKLLRVLEARTVRRLGSVEDRRVDVRFVAATNRNLESMVAKGQFRGDVFYRVAVVRARIPALRDRPDDVPLLAADAAERISGGRITLTRDAVDALMSYDWPGNARQLRNVIERAVALSQSGRISAVDLFGDENGAEDALTFKSRKDQVIAEFEARYVRGLLARHDGNVSSAAREAGMSRNALYALMKRAGIEG
jgi:two-component system response regulator GlrR